MLSGESYPPIGANPFAVNPFDANPFDAEEGVPKQNKIKQKEHATKIKTKVNTTTTPTTPRLTVTERAEENELNREDIESSISAFEWTFIFQQYLTGDILSTTSNSENILTKINLQQDSWEEIPRVVNFLIFLFFIILCPFYFIIYLIAWPIMIHKNLLNEEIAQSCTNNLKALFYSFFLGIFYGVVMFTREYFGNVLHFWLNAFMFSFENENPTDFTFQNSSAFELLSDEDQIQIVIQD